MMLPIFFAFSAILIRLALFYLGYENNDTSRYLILMHILFILLSVFFSAMNFSKAFPEKNHFTQHLKIGFKGGAVYTLIITAFLGIYYGAINNATFMAKRDTLVAAQIEAGGDQLDADAIARLTENIESFFTVLNYCTITFISFLLVSFVYAAGVAILIRLLKKLK